MSAVHTSNEPDPLPTAKSILCMVWTGTASDSTEIGTQLTDTTCLEI